jgi:protease-4
MILKALLLIISASALVTITSYSKTSERTRCHQIHIAIIPIEGFIEADSHSLVKLLEVVCQNKKYAAVLLLISSGGGSSSGALFIEDAIDFCKTHKPVVAYIPDMCMSGAYWLALAADYIIANPTALIGSIGVVSTITEHTNATYTSDGLQFQLHVNEVTTKPSCQCPDGIEADVYDQFREDVMARRPYADRTNPDLWSDGKIITGRRALTLKLIDEVGSYTEALEAIRRLLEKDGIYTKQCKMRLTYEQP